MAKAKQLTKKQVEALGIGKTNLTPAEIRASAVAQKELTKEQYKAIEAGRKLVGAKVDVRSKQWPGHWGYVVAFDGRWYHVAGGSITTNDFSTGSVPVFARRELVVKQPGAARIDGTRIVERTPVELAYWELHYEAQQQIDNILVDDGLELDQVDLAYLVHDVKWTIERMHMDIGDGTDPFYARNVIKSCEAWLKRWSK